jgi:putative sterol carrier protein
MNAKIFLESLKERVEPEDILGEQSKIAFDLAGEHGGQYTLVIEYESMTVEHGLHEDASCSVKCEFVTLQRIISKDENVMMAMMMGKLKIKNQMEMIKYAKILGFM